MEEEMFDDGPLNRQIKENSDRAWAEAQKEKAEKKKSNKAKEEQEKEQE